MSPFTTNQIENKKTFTIVNVGSYKTRAIIARFEGSKITLCGYGEKRQSRLDIINNEIINSGGVCDTILEAIAQAEEESGYECDNIIINPFFSSLFFFSKKIAHKRTDPSIQLTNKELEQIVNHTQGIATASIRYELAEKFGTKVADVELILNNMSAVYLDGNRLDDTSVVHGEDISVHLMSCFIPRENYKIISDMALFMGKRIVQMIPEEYSLTRIDSINENAVYVNVGNTCTLVSIKDSKDSILGSVKVEIGIESLIKQITKSSRRNRSDIIKKLDREDLFRDEKIIFLEVFTQFICEGLKEILGTQICPAQFILSGGGAHNVFIKNYLSRVNFFEKGVKIVGKVSVTHPGIDALKDIVGIEKILSQSTISILSQVLTTNELLQKKLISD